MLFDTHCHLDIIEKFGLYIEEVLKNAIFEKVSDIVQISTDIKSSKWSLNFVKNYQNSELNIYCALGLHPESVLNRYQIEEMIQFIKMNIQEKKVIGIGETGLDFYQNPDTKDLQIESLYEHMKLAKEFSLPIIIHSRDDKVYNESRIEAIKFILKIAKELNIKKGVIHCFTYSYKEAKLFVDLGWKISFSGILTFKNANFIQETTQKIPLEHILIETDAPFLSPVPKRGKTNEPSYIRYTAEFLSNLLNLNYPETIEILRKNSMEIFNLLNTKN